MTDADTTIEKLTEAPSSPVKIQNVDSPMQAGATCGMCVFGCSVSADLRHSLECRRFPPQVYLLPNQKGEIMEHWVYPKVRRTNPACGEIKIKNSAMS